MGWNHQAFPAPSKSDHRDYYIIKGSLWIFTSTLLGLNRFLRFADQLAADELEAHAPWQMLAEPSRLEQILHKIHGCVGYGVLVWDVRNFRDNLSYILTTVSSALGFVCMENLNIHVLYSLYKDLYSKSFWILYSITSEMRLILSALETI